MPADRGATDGDKPHHWYSPILAENEDLDRPAMWRLGTWGVAAVGALIASILAAQSSITFRRDQTASLELSKQAQQLQWIAKESQSENRKLASAVETLSADRDRLYTRITSLEQNLDSVTGSVARRDASLPKISSAPVTEVTAPIPKPVQQTAPPPQLSKPATAEPAAKPASEETTVVASAPPTPEVAAGKPVARTEFGVDIGTANSVEGLRALWKGAVKSTRLLEPLQPLIVVQEQSGGFGMQLRLVAGPFADAAAAASACAAISSTGRGCETSVYNGQKLSMQADPRPVGSIPAKNVKRRAAPRAEAAPARSSNFPPLFGNR